MDEYFREVLSGLARRGLKARLVARPDACTVCRNLQGRVFEPLEAPSIPVEGCLTPPCRCRYESCDPRSAIASLMKAGIAAAKEGRVEEARELLYQVIDLDERNEKAWLWLSEVVTGLDERIVCLENVLAINPSHKVVREALNHLLATRKEVGPGQTAARKIKMAREAIGHIKASQGRAVARRETPPVQITPAMEKVVPEPLAEQPSPKPVAPVRKPVEPLREERISIRSVPMAFLYVLLAILILILVLVALTYTGIL
jgi:hypothetical protein